MISFCIVCLKGGCLLSFPLPPPCVTTNPRTPPSFLPHPPAPLPKVENLTISNITPYGFRVSWKVKQQQQRSQRQELAPSSGSFSHFHVVVTDSGWLLEPQEFTVPGNQSHLDVSGLITGIGYEVRVTGVSDSGLLSRPLTTVAVTGTTLREALRRLRPLRRQLCDCAPHVSPSQPGRSAR